MVKTTLDVINVKANAPSLEWPLTTDDADVLKANDWGHSWKYRESLYSNESAISYHTTMATFRDGRRSNNPSTMHVEWVPIREKLSYG